MMNFGSKSVGLAPSLSVAFQTVPSASRAAAPAVKLVAKVQEVPPAKETLTQASLFSLLPKGAGQVTFGLSSKFRQRCQINLKYCIQSLHYYNLNVYRYLKIVGKKILVHDFIHVNNDPLTLNPEKPYYSLSFMMRVCKLRT